MIEIRLLQENEVPYASGLTEVVYRSSIEPRWADPGLWSMTQNYIQKETLQNKVKNSELFLWGAFSDQTLCAVGGMQSEGHITMLYVLPQYQNQGIGKLLMDTMINYGFYALSLQRLTLSAMPAWTAPYFAKKKFAPIKQKGVDPSNPVFAYMELKEASVPAVYKKRAVSEKLVLSLTLGTLGLLIVLAVVFAVSQL